MGGQFCGWECEASDGCDILPRSPAQGEREESAKNGLEESGHGSFPSPKGSGNPPKLPKGANDSGSNEVAKIIPKCVTHNTIICYAELRNY